MSIILLFIVFIQIYTHKTPKNETKTQYNTFLVKTHLSKEQLLTLLNQEHPLQVNLKKTESQNKIEETEQNENVNQTNEIKEVSNIEPNHETLEEQIEDEIKADSLHPLDEFHVKQAQNPEVKSFVSKPNNRFIDSLYEKKFGKIYAYLTLILFICVMIYYKDILFNQKLTNKKGNYSNLFDYDSSKEYMLVKNQ